MENQLKLQIKSRREFVSKNELLIAWLDPTEQHSKLHSFPSAHSISDTLHHEKHVNRRFSFPHFSLGKTSLLKIHPDGH
jgi:uncharacterized protein YjaZ